MAYGTISADVIQSSVTGVSLGAGNATVFKNRIINGDMRIDQRNAGASVTPINGDYGIDRWKVAMSAASKFSLQQNAGSVTPPTGYINYLGITSASAYSLSASDYFVVRQNIEGLNIADLGWGTANAKTVTLSAWVYSSLTGTFGGALNNSGSSRSYPFTYSISTANTWTNISVTIAGDTSGTWLTTNGVGISVNFSVGTGTTYSGTAGSWSGSNYVSATGATSVVGTSGATFYLTGVQLEVGSSATGFEVVDYTTQLAMCQRYYQVLGNAVGNEIVIGAYGTTGATVYQTLPCKVTMRTLPTGVIVGTWYISNTAQPVFSGAGSSAISLAIVAAATGALVTASSTTAYFTLSAEL